MSAVLRRSSASWQAFGGTGRHLPPRWQPVLRAGAVWVALLVLEVVAHRALASTSLVASLLAPSSAAQVPALLAAAGFVGLRVLTLAVLPAYVLARAVVALLPPLHEPPRR